MKRYQFVLRVLGALLLISPNGYANNGQLIKLSDSVTQAQVSMVTQESHPIYVTVPYQTTCSKTVYQQEYQCHTNYQQQCGNTYKCQMVPVQKCDRGASLFDFSIFSVANAAELTSFGGHDGHGGGHGGGGGGGPDNPDNPGDDNPPDNQGDHPHHPHQDNPPDNPPEDHPNFPDNPPDHPDHPHHPDNPPEPPPVYNPPEPPPVYNPPEPPPVYNPPEPPPHHHEPDPPDEPPVYNPPEPPHDHPPGNGGGGGHHQPPPVDNPPEPPPVYNPPEPPPVYNPPEPPHDHPPVDNPPPHDHPPGGGGNNPPPHDHPPGGGGNNPPPHDHPPGGGGTNPPPPPPPPPPVDHPPGNGGGNPPPPPPSGGGNHPPGNGGGYPPHDHPPGGGHHHPPVCHTDYKQQCGYEYECKNVPVQKCGYESVPHVVYYSCTQYHQVVDHYELDFNVQGAAKVTMKALERIGNEELFNINLEGSTFKLKQEPVSTKNLVLLTKTVSQSQILKPDLGPKNPGLKQVYEEFEVGLIPLVSLNGELAQQLSEVKIQGNTLSFVMQQGLYADALNARLKLVLDKLMNDKTLFDNAVPAAAVTVNKYGESALVSIDLSQLIQPADAIKRGKKYRINLELNATFAKAQTQVLNAQLIQKSVKPEIKVKAE
jgi:hypothetical protein